MENADGKYKALTHYAGSYAYNGTVKTPDETEDGKYELTPNKFTISQFVEEMMPAYIKQVSGKDMTITDNKLNKKYVTEAANYTLENNAIKDWSKFIRYEGKVEGLTNTDPNYFFDESTDASEVLSAVNELMFAYSTDTGCLNTYMGYTVSAGKTSYVSEFEYAAQYAIKTYGVGGMVVCPSDYGWHIIYVSAVYDGGEVYGGFNVSDVENENEGSFSYKFFEALKNSTATQHMTVVQNQVFNEYKGSVTRYTKAYQDLLDLDK